MITKARTGFGIGASVEIGSKIISRIVGCKLFYSNTIKYIRRYLREIRADEKVNKEKHKIAAHKTCSQNSPLTKISH